MIVAVGAASGRYAANLGPKCSALASGSWRPGGYVWPALVMRWVPGALELLQRGVLAVPAQHQRLGFGDHVGADEEERVVAGQGAVVGVQVPEGLGSLGGGAEREVAP